MSRVFQTTLRGKGKFLFPHCSGMINFAGRIFLLGGENLTRSDFDLSKNCYLVGGNELLMGEKKNLVVGESTRGIFPGGGE